MTSSLPERPLVKRNLLVAAVEQDEVFILSEDRTWLWKNRKLAFLIRHLDGSRNLCELFELGGSHVSPPEVIYLLNQLQSEGLLAEGSSSALPGCSDAELGFWHAVGVGEYKKVESIQGSRIRLRNACSGSTQPLIDALEAINIAVVQDADAALDVVVADHYFHPELKRTNEEALRRSSPWMALKLVGQSQWIGPIFHPGRTACMACLQDRLLLNRQVEDFVVRKTSDPSNYMTSVASLPEAVRLCSTWAAQEIALWLAGRTDRLEGKVLSVSFMPKITEVKTHILTRRPQCPACGTPEQAHRIMPITLHPEGFPGGGGQRTSTPEATIERLGRHISPITGVVTWLSESSQDAEELVYSYAAGHSFSLGPDTTYWLRQSLRSRTGGKGTTASQAKASAICEAIERYCGVFREGTPCIRATYEALGDRAIHPYRCLNFSSRQYDRREELNADDHEGFFHRIPNRFCENVEIDWVRLWSLTDDEFRYLPAAFCYYGHPDVEKYFFCTADSNGCAAGNVIDEAIVHGFLELVERDSAAIWWYNQLRRPAIDLDSSSDTYIRRVREYYVRHGRELWAIDITSDLGIPVIAAVSERVDGPSADLLIGFGSSFDPSIALVKAITEVNQFLPAVSRRAPNGRSIYCWPDSFAMRFWENETLSSQPQLVPDSTAPPRILSEFPYQAGANRYDSVQACLAIAQRHGLEVLVLDQSRPDIDLSVVRVAVPGFRHFWRRLGPGRLYDVPVQLGWVAMPTLEEDLNPVSIFF